MAKSLLSSSRSTGTSEGIKTTAVTEYWWLSYATADADTTEANRQITFRTAGTISKLYVRVVSEALTGGNCDFTVRKNGADTALKVTIIDGGGAAVYEDTSDTVSVSAGDKLCYSTSNVAGTFTFALASVIFDATSNCVTRYVCEGYAATAASVTHYLPIAGQRSGTTTGESNVESTVKTAGTLKNVFVYVSANARTTDTTFTVRKNRAATALTVTYASGETGIKEDTADSVSVAVDDEIDWSITTGTGTETITLQMLVVDYETTSSAVMTTGAVGSTAEVLIDEPVTWYFTLGGGRRELTTTEADAQQKVREDGTFKNLIFFTNANAMGGNSTFRLRVNGADSALTTTIGAGATGFFVDTTHTVSVVANDLVCYAVTTPATGGTVTMSARQMGITLDVTPSGTSYNRSPSTDTVSISDASTTRLLSAVRTPSTDSSTVTDSSLTRLKQAFRAPGTDSSTVADVSVVGVKFQTFPRAPSTDSTTVTDSALTRLLSSARNPGTDTVTSADSSLTRLLSASRVPSTDTVTTGESMSGGKVIGRIPGTDTVTVADSSVTRLLQSLRTPSDTVASTENAVRMLSAFRSPSSDSTTVADVGVPTRIRTLTRTTTTDVATVTDSSLTRMLSSRRIPSLDTISVADSALQRLVSASRLVSTDTVGTSESIIGIQTKTYLRSPSTDNTAVTDVTLIRVLSALRVPSTDSVTVADVSRTRLLQLIRTVGPDTVAIDENVSGLLITPGKFPRAVFDAVPVVEVSLTRFFQGIRTQSDTSPVSENLVRVKTVPRAPATDTITVSAGTVTRLRTVNRLPTQDTINILETALTRLLQLARSANDVVAIAEIQLIRQSAHSRALQDTITVTEPLIQRLVTVCRTAEDIVEVGEQLFSWTWHRYVFDSVDVGEQLFIVRQALSGPVIYATPDEVRPLLGNLGSQRTDDQINLAIDAAYDEINTKTNRIPPNDWHEEDHNFGIVKKLTRYIAAKEMAIGIKDYDTRPLEMEIEHLFKDLLQYDTTSDATQDIVISSSSATYAASESGLIWSLRYPALRKNRSGSEGDVDTTSVHLME